MSSGPSPNNMRARRLLAGGVIGGHLAALLSVAAFLMARGTAAAVSAAIAGVVVIAFFTIGQAVQVMVADAPAKRVMFAAMASYAIRVSLLGIVLILVLDNAERFGQMDPTAVVATTISVVIGWLAGVFRVYSQLRFPIYDSTESSASKTGPNH